VSIKVIGIDIRVLVLGRRTGIEEYLLNLLPEIIRRNPEMTFRLFYNALRKQKLGYAWLDAPNVEVYSFPIPNRALLFPANALFNYPKADRLIGGCDVFWSPHIFNVALSHGVKHVITVHDLAFERHPDFFPTGKRWWHKYLMAPKRQLRSAHEVLAVSQSTKDDLKELYSIPEARIKVVYPGIGQEFKPLSKTGPGIAAVRKKYRLPGPFILYFGTIEPRKNIRALISAFELFKRQSKNSANTALVIAGDQGWLYREVFEAARRSPFHSHIMFTGFVDPEDKPALYNAAEVFVYPSFFEGFGFPPLEAMGCGIPVITANRSSLPEVAGDAAILVNPYRPEEIFLALEELQAFPDLRETMRQKGLARAAKFTWDSCAQETMAAFAA